MAKSRRRTNLIHIKNGEKFDVTKHKQTGVLYIKGTDQEVEPHQVRNRSNISKPRKDYDFNKPSWAQALGDEWDDYAWSGDDF